MENVIVVFSFFPRLKHIFNVLRPLSLVSLDRRLYRIQVPKLLSYTSTVKGGLSRYLGYVKVSCKVFCKKRP